MRSCWLSASLIAVLSAAVAAEEPNRPHRVTKGCSGSDRVVSVSESKCCELKPIAGSSATGAIITQLRLVKVPIGFCERVGIHRSDATILTERELKLLLEAVQGHPTASVMQFPTLTTGSGEVATLSAGDDCTFVTGVETTKVNGHTVLVPRTTTIRLGETVELAGLVSDDGQQVRLSVKLTQNHLINKRVDLVPITTHGTPIVELGMGATAVRFTQFLQAPEVQSQQLEKQVIVPRGGTVVLGSWKWHSEGSCPRLNLVPGVGQLIKSGSAKAQFEVIALATVQVVPPGASESGSEPGEEQCHVVPLRTVAASEAAQVVAARLDKQHEPVVVIGEPRSNTVLVKAQPAIAQRVAQLLAELDAPPPQIAIQGLIAQVPAGFLADIGFTDATEGTSVMTLTPRELNILSTQIRKATSNDTVDILARPQLNLSNGQTGVVQVGQQYPYASTIHTDGRGVVTKTVAQEYVGLTLRVTARTQPDGKVMLRVEPSLTSVAPAADGGPGGPMPVFTTQTLETSVLTGDGQPVVVHGLIESTTRDHPDDGPFTALVKKALGPVRREFILILTPRLVHPQPPAAVPAGCVDRAEPGRACRVAPPLSAPAPVLRTLGQ
jgi:type II secretory pathway component GspD/PulD (secretin)